ncbi:MAG: CinA family nicotinamide mononucleotide deamidase-related protein [Anaerolineales bacterium]|nr:CinA family nicotinamide mononucleotide deamidase-related protein [Anaerolineales bacterium]
MPVVKSAEIITVGTELLLGEIVDTNSARLAKDLAELGVNVYWSQRVGDNSGRLEQALTAALTRTDLIVLTGGLGPTNDDLTRDAVAHVVGEEQRVDPELERWLRSYFEARGAVMPDSNLRQAQVIDSATVLPNPIGTAPGWLVRKSVNGQERTIVTLPGPPRELERMWKQEARPRLEFPRSRLYVRTFKTLGLGESHVAEMLGALTDQANPSVATYAKMDGVHVRVAAKGDDLAAAEDLAGPTLQKVESLLGDRVWGRDSEELPRLVIDRLAATGRKVAIAEGLTGGLVSSWLTEAWQLNGNSVSGESVAGSVIAYEPELMRTLGVPANLLERLPAGAAEVVAALAVAIKAFFKADLGVAIGPYTLPAVEAAADGPAARMEDPDEVKRLPTQVAIAVARDVGTTVRTLELPALGKSWQRERTAISSLNLLRLELR